VLVPGFKELCYHVWTVHWCTVCSQWTIIYHADHKVGNLDVADLVMLLITAM
jgi:hypothetical protein